MDLLTAGGVSEELFYNAYFENYDLKHPDRVPHWKVMVAKVAEIFGSGFLQRLNKLIKEKGIDEAISRLKTDPKSI